MTPLIRIKQLDPGCDMGFHDDGGMHGWLGPIRGAGLRDLPYPPNDDQTHSYMPIKPLSAVKICVRSSMVMR